MKSRRLLLFLLRELWYKLKCNHHLFKVIPKQIYLLLSLPFQCKILQIELQWLVLNKTKQKNKKNLSWLELNWHVILLHSVNKALGSWIAELLLIQRSHKNANCNIAQWLTTKGSYICCNTVMNKTNLRQRSKNCLFLLQWAHMLCDYLSLHLKLIKSPTANFRYYSKQEKRLPLTPFKTEKVTHWQF